eukprot:3936210-Rhodomonas_salina.1
MSFYYSSSRCFPSYLRSEHVPGVNSNSNTGYPDPSVEVVIFAMFVADVPWQYLHSSSTTGNFCVMRDPTDRVNPNRRK